MSRHDYWLDAVGEALCGIGAFETIPEADRVALAKSMEDAADTVGQAYPTPSSGPHPLQLRIDELEAQVERARLAGFKRDDVAVEQFGRATGVHPSWLTTDGSGRVVRKR